MPTRPEIGAWARDEARGAEPGPAAFAQPEPRGGDPPLKQRDRRR